MSDLQLDERGFIMSCPSCGQRNRVAFSTREARCGRCKSALPPPSQPIEVPDARAFDALVRDARHPVVVDFWAPWCGPCRMVSPVLDKLARERAGRIKLVNVDVDHAPRLSSRFDLQAIPTLMIIDGGKVVARQAGAVPAEALRSWLDGALAGNRS